MRLFSGADNSSYLLILGCHSNLAALRSCQEASPCIVRPWIEVVVIGNEIQVWSKAGIIDEGADPHAGVTSWKGQGRSSHVYFYIVALCLLFHLRCRGDIQGFILL